MLKLANLCDDNVVVDIGSGDGLIVVPAAKMTRNCAVGASISTRS